MWRLVLPRVVLLPFPCVSRSSVSVTVAAHHHYKSSKQQRYGSALLCLLAVATLPPPILCDVSTIPQPPPNELVDVIVEKEETVACYSYGCPLFPQDVYYNTTVRQALQQLEQDSSLVSPSLHSCGTNETATLTLIGYKGGDPNFQINQDRALVVSPYRIHTQDETTTTTTTNTRLLGVFDGHAKLGEGVSQHVVEQLPLVLADKLQSIYHTNTPQQHQQQQEQTRQALIETFQQLDKTAPAEISGGCTASVILQLDEKVYIANAGDSVSFLAVYHATTNTTSLIYTSREDKPTLPEERQRVEQMGGKVHDPEQGTSRVLYTDPRTGYTSGLAMSRSIGDWEAGKVGVVPTPIVDVIDIPSVVAAHLNDVEDDVYIFAVSATDGMMDFIHAETIASTLGPSLFSSKDKENRHVLTACNELISAAALAWQRAKQGRYRDDIAIAVSTIRIPPSHNDGDDMDTTETRDDETTTRRSNEEL